MQDKFISIPLQMILVGIPLPANVYLCIDGRYITFRTQGDVVDRNIYDKLEFKKVTQLFIHETDHERFRNWAADGGIDPQAAEKGAGIPIPPGSVGNKPFLSAREDAHRKTLDIFQSAHPDAHVAALIASSKKLVAEVMKFPYAVQSLGQLQSFSRGTVDHSINVSILSIYLALQMGYSHQLILQHVAVGALLHDIGKRKVDIQENDSPETVQAKMKEHPTLGQRILEGMEGVPNEVMMIVAQHHERHDGTGFPKKLRGNNTYDLARIVAIANVFDELVATGKGSLTERQRQAVLRMDQMYFNGFDPDKHDKAVRILKLGI